MPPPTQLSPGFADPPSQESQGEWSKKGRSFNYLKNVVKPGKMGPVTTNPFTIVTHLRDNADYAIGSLVKGRDCRKRDLTLGNRFFVASGVCDRKKSAPQCRGKTRYLFIDNMPTRTMPCIDTTQAYDPKCEDGGTGLMTAMVQDIVKINPFELMSSAVGRGSIVHDVCEPRTEMVGYTASGGGKCTGASKCTGMGQQRCEKTNGCKWTQSASMRYMRPETRCAPQRRPLVCSLQIGESSCRVSTKAVAAERVKDGVVLPTAGTNAIGRSIYAYNGGDRFSALFEHVRSHVRTLREQNIGRPYEVLHWVEVGTTRRLRSIYALYDSSQCEYVSEIGLMLRQRPPETEAQRAERLASEIKREREKPTDRYTHQEMRSSFVKITLCSPCPEEAHLKSMCDAVVLTNQGTMLFMEYSNHAMDTLLKSVVRENSMITALPRVLARRGNASGADKYDMDWQDTVTYPARQVRDVTGVVREKFGGAHEILNRALRAWKPSPKADNTDAQLFVLKQACSKRIAKCENNYVLYEWISTIYRPRRMYGFQILWRAYRKKGQIKVYITNASVVGNPEAQDIPRAVRADKVWTSIEGFYGGRAVPVAPAAPAVDRRTTLVTIIVAVAVVTALGAGIAHLHRKKNVSSQSAARVTVVGVLLAVAAAVALNRNRYTPRGKTPDLPAEFEGGA